MTVLDRQLRRAGKWLENRDFPTREAIGDRGEGADRVVVIPVLAESRRLFSTLHSLARNPAEELRRTLVVCVVNNRAEHHADADQVADNQLTLRSIEQVLRGVPTDLAPDLEFDGLRLAFIDASSTGLELEPKMGVGEARRIGLDHGLTVLCRNQVPDGLLISLDGDTTVETEYLLRAREHFERSCAGAAVVAYAHPLPSDEKLREAIVLYELFLRYHEFGLRMAGSPYAIPTIGSTIIVRGNAYMAAGGMNRKQAGEDFYFLQQLVKTDAVARIDTTTVRPAARPSSRVPFGTGASISRHLGGGVELEKVYHPESYRVLGRWLSLVHDRLTASADELLAEAGGISAELEAFLDHQSFARVWPKLRRNARDRVALGAQFHRWFDGFKSLKLLHHLRDADLVMMPVEEAIAELCGVRATNEDAAIERWCKVLSALRGECRRVPPAPATVRCWDDSLHDLNQRPSGGAR